MRALVLLSLAGLGACTAASKPGADPHAAQEGVCAMTVADHVGAPVDAVTASWDHATADGGGVVTVAAKDSVHTCEIGADLAVHRILHPGAQEA